MENPEEQKPIHVVHCRECKPDAPDPLVVRCPTCGVPPGVRCKLSSGEPRTGPHRERRFVAKDNS
jgi:hypothetical protein